jgi:uncharacterized protein (TIGR02757 family)
MSVPKPTPAPDAPPAWLVPRRYRSAATAEAARRRLAKRLGPVLDRFLDAQDPRARLPRDPLAFVHRHLERADREIVALVAAGLAYGNVKAIGASIERVLAAIGPAPARTLGRISGEELAGRLEGFVHRWTRGPDVAALLFAAARLQEAAGSLGRVFEDAFDGAGGDLRVAIGRFAGAVRSTDFRPIHGERAPPRGLAYLLPDGTGPGACKRLHMLLRWMVRGPDGVDLGLWDVPASALLMPLDTHTGRISRYLGLTERRDLTWRTAEEVTWRLRAIRPDDPVRYDFVLAHLGIARGCRHRRVPSVCGGCALAEACRL